MDVLYALLKRYDLDIDEDATILYPSGFTIPVEVFEDEYQNSPKSFNPYELEEYFSSGFKIVSGPPAKKQKTVTFLQTDDMSIAIDEEDEEEDEEVEVEEVKKEVKKKVKKDQKKEELVSIKRLANGQLEITTNKRTILIDKRTAEYVESKEMLRNLKLNDKGYICSNQTPLHRIVGDQFCKTGAQVRAQYPDHFATNPTDTIVVMHLDDDKLNFNIGNLERGPQMLNRYMQMSQPQPRGDKFIGSISVDKKVEATKAVSTVDEAKHAMDILKIQKLPLYFREFIFNHSMHKPAEYAVHYTSVETLLARAPEYAKRPQKPQKPRESKNIYEAFRTLDEASKALTGEQMKTITEILKTDGVTPFDPALDCIVRYTGSLKKVQHVLLMEYACYEQHLKKTRPAMSTNSNGYLQIKLADGSNYIHNVVLGRPLGQKARDGLDGGHGYGKTLDNRKRTMEPQKPSVNMSQRGGANDKSVPGVVGVTRTKYGKFKAQIGTFFERADTVYLGTYTTAEEASDVFQFADANKAELAEACKDLKDPATEVRARCLAKRRGAFGPP